MCSASTVFLLRRTLLLPDVRQARSVTGCKSLQTIPMPSVPSMTWTQSFRSGRSALALAGTSRCTTWSKTWLWSLQCDIKKRLATSLCRTVLAVQKKCTKANGVLLLARGTRIFSGLRRHRCKRLKEQQRSKYDSKYSRFRRCQTNSNQSQFAPECVNLCGTKLTSLRECGGSVELEVVA